MMYILEVFAVLWAFACMVHLAYWTRQIEKQVCALERAAWLRGQITGEGRR